MAAIRTNLTNQIERAAFGVSSRVSGLGNALSFEIPSAMNLNERNERGAAKMAGSCSTSPLTLNERLDSNPQYDQIPASHNVGTFARGYGWGKSNRSIRGGNPCVLGVH